MRTLALFAATLVAAALPAASQSTFSLDDPVLSVDGRRVATMSGPLQHDAFEMLTVVVPGDGTYRISDRPFAGALRAGQFEGDGLVFAVGGRSVRLRGRSDLLSDPAPTPAYVAYEPASGRLQGGPARLSVSPDGAALRTAAAEPRRPQMPAASRPADAPGRVDRSNPMRGARQETARQTGERRRTIATPPTRVHVDRGAPTADLPRVLDERNALLAERDRLLTERDQLVAERERALRDRDALARQLSAMQRPAEGRAWTEDRRRRAERDAAHVERDALLSDREALQTAQATTALAEAQDLESAAALATDRDALVADRDALRLERETARFAQATAEAAAAAPSVPSIGAEGPIAFLPGFDFARLQNPELVRRRLNEAAYPRWGVIGRIEGDVLVLFQTDPTGRVIRTAVPSPLGGGLDGLAEAIVQDMQFVPPVVEGRPTGLRSQVVVRFEL